MGSEHYQSISDPIAIGKKYKVENLANDLIHTSRPRYPGQKTRCGELEWESTYAAHRGFKTVISTNEETSSDFTTCCSSYLSNTDNRYR